MDTCCSASPNIEQTRWVSEQNQIVVKSSGNHGPATVKLFNSRTGRLEGWKELWWPKNLTMTDRNESIALHNRIVRYHPFFYLNQLTSKNLL